MGSTEQLNPAYEIEEEHEETDEQGRTIRVIDRLRLIHVSMDPRHQPPPQGEQRPQ